MYYGNDSGFFVYVGSQEKYLFLSFSLSVFLSLLCTPDEEGVYKLVITSLSLETRSPDHS